MKTLILLCAVVGGFSSITLAQSDTAKPSLPQYGKPVPNVRGAVQKDCREVRQIYDYIDGMSCKLNDEIKLVRLEKIVRNNLEHKGWRIEVTNGEKFKDLDGMMVLDYNPLSRNKPHSAAKEFCEKTEGAAMPNYEELDLLGNAGFFHVLEKSPSLKSVGILKDNFENVQIWSARLGGKDVIARRVVHATESDRIAKTNPNKITWNNKDGFDVVLCVTRKKA